MKKPQKDNAHSPAADAMRVYQFARSIGKSASEVLEMCKLKSIDVRNHMSTIPAEVVTKLTQGIEESADKKKPRSRRRRRRGGKRSKTAKGETLPAEKTAQGDGAGDEDFRG